MKVDMTKLKKGSSELTPECRELIEQIGKSRSHAEMLDFLKTVEVWVYGKCELYHWIEILDRFDKILEEAARHVTNEFVLQCDTTFSPEDIQLLLLVLNFTTLLIEHSFSRHLYNSIEHLTQLLSSQNMDIVLAVLNLLYMFSKRSNFIPRLTFDKKELLLIKLLYIAERWGDPNYGLALIDCCLRRPKLEFLYQLFIEYMDENGHIALLEIPDMMDICNSAPLADVVKIICKQLSNPSDAVKMRIAHRVRLVSGFKDYKLRLQFVQARLQAVSVLIYSNALQDNIDKILYTGFGEELCELIDKEDADLVDIRAAVLRTLTSMLHFDRNPNIPRPGSRLPKIIQYTGAERQGGTLPLLVRDCIASLAGDKPLKKYPLVLATSLFSLLYHLASYETGGHALVKSGMMQSLLQVISWPGVDLEHITFVTRAVRVIDLITNIDIAKFHQHNGLNVFIERLEKEINSCRKAITDYVDLECKEKEVVNRDLTHESSESIARDAASSETDQEEQDRNAFEHNNEQLDVLNQLVDSDGEAIAAADVDDDLIAFERIHADLNSERDIATPEDSEFRYPSNSYYSRPLCERNADTGSSSTNFSAKKNACVTQRAALLKSMLNFLKKSIQDHAHFNGMRNIMETSLPSSLRHIISNAEYYGPSLFLLATDVVTVYVFNEPSLLSSLQDLGITNVMLQSLLQKDVPATREVLGSLPNVFSALCLNERGLMEFMSYEPFDKLLRVLLSPDYLVAMRRRRSSDPLGDTATNLGNAMDDLMKHHPYLRTDATEAIVRLLNELVRLGTDHNFICWRANKDANNAGGNSNNASGNNSAADGTNNAMQNMANVNAAAEPPPNENENDNSGDDDDDDDEISSASQQQQQRQNRTAVTVSQHQMRSTLHEREAIPLIDYILNVMKFIEAIFTNSSNGEHCREFVLHGGLKPLLQLLSLPNLPVDSPVSTTAQAVANVCKSILNLAHETKVIEIALQQLSQIVDRLKPLIKQFNYPGGSVLLSELLNCPKIEDGFSIADYTPLLHSMSSVHGYVVMLVHICRNASNEMRSILLKRWGTKSNNGLHLLQNLVQLYISLVWESTVLLSLCSEEPYAQTSEFNFDEATPFSPLLKDDGDSGSQPARKFNRICAAKAKLKPEEQLRYIKSLLAASSRLGRALAELFGTLVKLSVGTPQSRRGRNNDYVTSLSSSKFPTPDAREIARVLSSILVNGFCHENIVPRPAPKLKLTFLICSVGFTGPMLFDDKRNAFHLMISKFCEENGLKAFFDMFYWALSLDNAPSSFSFEHCLNIDHILENNDDDVRDFPDGTGEFLDAWLQLLEKMVNPRAILDSPYSIATRTHHPQDGVQFESLFYIIQMHQLALHSIRRIWKRKPITNYGASMTETIMTIMKHLIKSHAMLSEKYEAKLNEATVTNTNTMTEESKRTLAPFTDAGPLNVTHLELLTDMGFFRAHALEALINTRSLEQATEYLLNRPEASAQHAQQVNEAAILPTEPSTIDTAESAHSMDTEMDIDMDKPENLLSNASGGSAAASGATCSTSTANAKPVSSCRMSLADIKLIPPQVFNDFCEEAMQRIYAFMEYLPETVSSGAELISVLYRRHNQTNRHQFVINLVRNISEWTDLVYRNLKPYGTSAKHAVKLEELVAGNTADRLFIRFKVSTLLLDEVFADIRKELCLTIAQEHCLSSLIKLLIRTEAVLEEQMSLGKKTGTPRWLQNLVEFIDAIENVSVILQRKANMRAVCSDNWKWYDASTGKWNGYSEANSSLIRNAFKNGDHSVVINIGRQRYTINFTCMTQVSEASGSHRPVLPALKITEALTALAVSGGANSSAVNPKIENILTRTIQSKSDGNGVTQQDEVLSLRSLLDINSEEKSDSDVAATQPLDKDNVDKAQQANTTATEHSDPAAQADDSRADNNSCNVKKGKAGSKGASAKTNTKKSQAASSASSASSSLKNVQRIVLHEEAVGLAKFDINGIINCLVKMLQPTLELNFETKLSILKLCARLTKDYENAHIFAQKGGIDLLLRMRQSCGLMGFPSYAIIIIRHLLEAPAVLQESIERILTARTAQPIPAGHRDLVYVLTQVSSAVARHPRIFITAARQVLRADCMTSPTFAIDDSRLLVRTNSATNQSGNRPPSASMPTMAAAAPSATTATGGKPADDPNKAANTSIEVVKKLLLAVVQPCVHYGGGVIPMDEEKPDLSAAECKSDSSGQPENPKVAPAAKKLAENYKPSCCSWHIPSGEHTHQKPIFPRATLLKILADAVRSYQSFVPQLIVTHNYVPNDSPLIKVEQSCLTFILDNFLPIVRRQQDSEVSMMSRVLVSSLADCYGQSTVQTKVVQEIHYAIVRALAQAECAEKHIRLQVLIGLFPMLIESPMLLNKMQVQRNSMYRILLRQGIMTDLAKIAQYKDLSNTNTLATIYSILRPMELLLRLAVSPGPLSSKRIFFGAAPQGNTIANRRFYPRLTSRTTSSGTVNSIGNDTVLRDIIRNVLSDRRHALDFIFNGDDLFIDAENVPPTAAANTDDIEDNEMEPTQPVAASNVRPQLNFDRLWDDLLQNEHLRRMHRNGGNANTNTINNGNDRIHNETDQESGNNDNGVGGGSDGASTSSEAAAAVVENSAIPLGETSSSESDSDSSLSAENDERNEDEDEDEDDDDEDDDGNEEEGIEDRSETDADEESRQFIEVFDHIYERESSETASNDADVDADDEASEMGGGGGGGANGLANTSTTETTTAALTEEMQNEQSTSSSTEQQHIGEAIQQHASVPTCVVESANSITQTFITVNASSAVRTTPSSSWVTTPRGEGDGHIGTYRSSGNLNAPPNAAVVSIVGDSNDNAAASTGPSMHMNAANNVAAGGAANNNNNINSVLRREPTRRLLFLDQQYCAPMPSFSNPTEEGQIELFNQDALHWWLEEAKHLDLESQPDACLYVAHNLLPFLIKDLKIVHNQRKADSAANVLSNTATANRRSAIPILIHQQANNTAVPASTTAAAVAGGGTTSLGITTPTPNDANTTGRSLNLSGVQNTAIRGRGFRMPQRLLGTTHRSMSSSTSSQSYEHNQQNTHNEQLNLLDGVHWTSRVEAENAAVAEANDTDDIDEDDDEIYDDDDDDDDDEDDDEDPFNAGFVAGDELASRFNINLDSEIQHASSAEPQPPAVPRDATAVPLPSDRVTGVNDDAVPMPETAAAATQDTATTQPGAQSDSNGTNSIDTTAPTPTPTPIPIPTPTPIPIPTLSAEHTTRHVQIAQPTVAASVATTTHQAAEMNAEVRAALGDLEVPDGVDPSFLAALPSEMREEVIQEHLRMQRVRQRAQQNAGQVTHDSLLEVNPEFLAALPPNIQSEVLMQQRIEQQRQAAQSANPDDPVDPAAFFQNLPESLRQAILTDMEESQISSLPPDLAAEAQYLRRDWETRNGARPMDSMPPNTLSGYLTARYPSTLNDDSRWHTNSIWYDANGIPQLQQHQHTTIVHQHPSQFQGKPIALLLMEDEQNLLDPDSLATLLLFLFIEDTKINYTRLHRVIRNLCYHVPTREWIINALLSIIEKTNEDKLSYSIQKAVKPNWIKLRVDAAFGYKSNVFIINKIRGGEATGYDSSCPNYSININPQAAQMVVRNCLDLLFVLAKHFPRSFLPFNREQPILGKSGDVNVTNNYPYNETTGIGATAPASVGVSTNPFNVAPTVASVAAPTGGGANAGGGENVVLPEEMRTIFHPAVPANPRNRTILQQQQQQQMRPSDGSAVVVKPLSYDAKLDDCPSTSKAAAIRSQFSADASNRKGCAPSKELLQYNTNSKHFWDVLLNIDLGTQKRMSNVQTFPVSSYPSWKWEMKTIDFLSFNESPFSKLLKMLPYKVICRSPMLTDLLVKLLASLSGELPKETDALSVLPVDPPNQAAPKTTDATSAGAAIVATTAVVAATPPVADNDAAEKNLADVVGDTEEKKAPDAAIPPPLKLQRKMYSKNFSQLQLVVEVLTHQCGSTEGLDNISKLIANLSNCSQASNAILLQYLTSAIFGLAQEVRKAIQNLFQEIVAYNAAHNAKVGRSSAGKTPPPAFASTSNAQLIHSIMQDRFTAEHVVISAPVNVKPSCELQLPAIKKLLSPSSPQPYFLRALKIFIQIRDLFESNEAADAAAAADATATPPTNKRTLSQIISLGELWNTLSDCLVALEDSKDEYAVLVLQPTVEAFFLIHASNEKNSNKAKDLSQSGSSLTLTDEEANSSDDLQSSRSTIWEKTATGAPPTTQPDAPINSQEAQLKLDRQNFLSFAEKHRTVLNQILRQSSTHLSDGPFAVLVDHTRILDFDVKRKYFQTELERIDEGVRREENTVSVRRVTVFEDSFRVLYRLGPEEWKNRFYIVFEDEEGQDAGGLLREWYVIISREIFNPMYALFCVSPGDRVTYMINPSSHANPNHLSYFKFVGRVIAKAVHDNKLLECYFTRSFYKHILGKQVKHTDMESQDYEFYKGLDYLMKNDISTLGYDLTFSTEVQEFGVTQVRDLIPNGRDVTVTEENKFEYVQLVCQLKMSGSIRHQLDAFLEGFYDIIPKHLISIFNEQELELLISGLPDIDIEDLKANTEYHKYTSKSVQIQWFWRALRSFDQADRAKFLQFVTGTSKVPLQGFGSLEGMNGIQKFQIHRDDRSTDRLPCAHTCFNQLDLPMYKSYDKLRSSLLKAIHECSEGFGFA